MITSTKNPRVTAAAKLKKRAFRDREARFLVEGAQVTQEAIDAGRVEVLFHTMDEDGNLDPLVVRARQSGVRTEAVTQQVVEHLTSTVTPQGIVGVATFMDVPAGELPPAPSLVAVLSGVRDPGNAGTILRSADAAGADAVVFGRESVDVYNPKTVRASAGSLFHVPVVRDVELVEAVKALRGRGLQVLATASDGERSIYETDLSAPTAVVFGNEAHGLDPGVRALADATVRVPIRGRAESLNLAAAAAVTLFEAVRAREGPAGLRAIGELIGPAGHDVRSPLTALTGFVGTLAKRWESFPDDERLRMVEGMVLDGQRTSALVRLVVDTVRILSGSPLTLTQDRTDVGVTAEWLAGLFALTDDFPDLVVEGHGTARSDPDRIRSLLFGLVDGAVWWGSEGPISVRVAEEGAMTIVEVSRSGRRPPDDEGPEDVLGSPDRGGRVSLYTARLVAEHLGGSLEAETGGGIRLRLRLPS